MAPQGIEVLGEFQYYITTSTESDYAEIIKQVRDLNPDAILLCDNLIGKSYEYIPTWIVPVMKKMDYLPKAMNIVSLLGPLLATKLYPDGTVKYMTDVVNSHINSKGLQFTEDSAPYSNVFTNEVPTLVSEALLVGSNLPGHNSSARLFNLWFQENFGTYSNDASTFIWSTFDVVEAALWRAGNSESMALDGQISSSEMMDMLMGTNAATPASRVVFDHHRYNTESVALVAQWFDSLGVTEIVAPSHLSTHDLLYPMPGWSEREYKWSLFKGSASNAVVLASIISSLLLLLAVTVTVHRSQMDVKMLNFGHVVGMLFCCIMFVWALVFVWQGDVNQLQFDSLLWTIYLPVSFIVQLMNMKAYRLSVFLTSEEKSRLKRFSHNRVLAFTIGWVSGTAALLLIAQLADPPTATKVVIDEYRPSQDYYVCRYGTTTSAILYFLLISHMIMSGVCVAIVRNGSEAFKDGMRVKEAFVILFACIIITYIFSLLNLSPQSFYLLRTSFLGLGVLLFCYRLLLSRCLKHWIPTPASLLLLRVYHKVASTMSQYHVFTTNVHNAHTRVSVEMKDLAGDELGLLDDQPGDEQVTELNNVLKDPTRRELLRDIAKKSLILENVEFLEAISELSDQYSDALIAASPALSAAIYDTAERLFNKYCAEGSEKEINISSSVREQLRLTINARTNTPVLTKWTAEYVIQEDLLEMGTVFDKAASDIRLMLYQNIWNEFRATETEIRMGQGHV